MAADTTDDFQKELVDLFVQEAHEWLQNIHVALDELQQGPAPERHAKLIGTISAGGVNLGGFAGPTDVPRAAPVGFQTDPLFHDHAAAHKWAPVLGILSSVQQSGASPTQLTR